MEYIIQETVEDANYHPEVARIVFIFALFKISINRHLFTLIDLRGPSPALDLSVSHSPTVAFSMREICNSCGHAISIKKQTKPTNLSLYQSDVSFLTSKIVTINIYSFTSKSNGFKINETILFL